MLNRLYVSQGSVDSDGADLESFQHFAEPQPFFIGVTWFGSLKDKKLSLGRANYTITSLKKYINKKNKHSDTYHLLAEWPSQCTETAGGSSGQRKRERYLTFYCMY